MIILPDFRIHQRDYLLKISRAITAQLDLDVVLRMVLEASVSMLGGEVGMIALRGPEQTLSIEAVLGIEPDEIEVLEPLLNFASFKKSQDKDAKSGELQLHLRLISRKLNRVLRQVVSLPLQISGESLGVIYVLRAYPGSPTPDDLLILQSFADQAAIAVHNAGLYQATIAEKRRLATILDASGDGIMILDAQLKVKRINPMLSSMTGWQMNFAVDRPHDDVIRWAEPVPKLTLEKAIADGWPYNVVRDSNGEWESAVGSLYVEGDLERLDGMRLSVEIKYAPVFFEDGSLRNIIANVRDITRFRQAEEMKSTFISVISHELKTPVALIKGYAQTLQRDDAEWDKETIQRGLSIIEEEADRLTYLIENLLMASRLQSEGVLRLNMGEVALDELVADVLERFKTQTNQHQFVLEFQENFPTIQGDEARLRQVFDNLISNAIKYSPDGGLIKISGQYTDDLVQITVQDNGIGISSTDVTKIFDRFFRAQEAIEKGLPGTGLGLFLVRVIIEAHGGQIWAKPNQGQPGTTFILTLPRR